MANLSLFWVVLWFFRVGITGNSNLQFSSLTLLSKTLNQRVRHLRTKEKRREMRCTLCLRRKMLQKCIVIENLFDLDTKNICSDPPFYFHE